MPRVRFINDDNPPPSVSRSRRGKFYRYCDNCGLALSRTLDQVRMSKTAEPALVGKVVCPRCEHADTNPR